MASKQGRSLASVHNAVLPNGLRLCAAAVLYALCYPAHAQDEIAPFRLTGIEGHVELRYRQDEEVIGSAGSSSTETRTSTEEEFFILTHSYIYHPNFLKMDLGIGPVFSQADLESTTGNRSDDTNDYNASVQLHFLDEKPYPLLLYYNRDNPTVALTVTDRFVQKSEQYGFDFQLKEPILPFKLTVAASNHKTDGEGFERIVKDDIDQATVRAEIPIKKDGYAQFIFNTTESRSESGFRFEPVVLTTTQTDSYTLDSRVLFGDSNQYQLTNYLTYTEQGGLRPLNEWRYTPDLRWTHSEMLESYYRFNYSNSDQVTVTTENIGASGGFRYTKKDNFDITGELHTDNTKSTGQELNSYGGNVTGTYFKEYSFGTLSLHAGLNLDFYDRVASGLVPVRDLLITLTGSELRLLPDSNIDVTSPNFSLTEVLSGGGERPLFAVTSCTVGSNNEILYTIINSLVQLQRCPGVSDPILISVDYDYDPGGTVAYTNLIQTYQANLQIYKNYNLYVRYRDSDATLKSGTPTRPLDESRNTSVGFRVDYPLFNSVRVGGEVQYENEVGTLNSYDRDSFELYTQLGIFNGVLYLNTQHVFIDYANTDQDTDLTRNALQFRVRPWSRVTITAELSTEEETGGSTTRQTQIEALTAEWRVRRLIMQAEARHLTDKYDTSERARSLVRVTLRREF